MNKEKRREALGRQIGRLERRIEELELISNRLSWLRLAVFAAGVIASMAVFFLGYAGYFWIPLVLGFLALFIVIYYHRRIEQSVARHKIWVDIKKSQIARMELDWVNIGPSPFSPEAGLELDLDLVGEYSLLRLISTAVSPGGKACLREWLATTTPDPRESQRRQRIVKELVPLSLLRDKLVLYARYASRGDGRWDPDKLLAWLGRHALPASIRTWLILLGILAALNISLFFLNLAGFIPPLWQVTFLIYVVLFLVRSRELGEPFGESAQIRDALEQLVAVFQELENFSYQGRPHLQALCAPFLDPDQQPSRHLKRFNRIVNATGVRGNPIIWLLLNAVVPWDYYFAYRLDRYKSEMATRLPVWMALWFELEALGSLANLAYLNPAYTFPELNDTVEDRSNEPLAPFQAADLGHPLIPDGERICNDFGIGHIGEIDIFTGSNMSGKSTFLRTVGINLVLAFAGGPVNARSMRTIPFRLCTCIRISDSVTDGISYFYAEVKCLKALLEQLSEDHPHPLFYFIDEIFRGTNNRERLIGSRSYIQAVAGSPGVGLIATHDLELIQLAGEIKEIRNYHFTDEVYDGRMVFDYKVHPGPSPTTNALKIMRLEGLPV